MRTDPMRNNPAMSRPPLYVTRPYLPPLEEFTPLLREIWDSRVLTNGGPFHQRLEAALAEYLGVPHVALFNNGTVALMVALQALQVQGEVITTPYTFVATPHALLWNKLTPVFVDIDPRTGNLDPALIEEAISERTAAILPVHCYGEPCDTAAIAEVARRRRLPVIYDAAHAFGVQRDGRSLLLEGDLSVLSFHATKTFHTFEGGAVVCHDAAMKRRIDDLKNFGFRNQITVIEAGLNGKMNEMQAAFGLLMLNHIDELRERRAAMVAQYDALLAGVPGIARLARDASARAANGYYPVLIEPGFGLHRDEVHRRLEAKGIFTRRYFYPLVSDMPMYRDLPSAHPLRLPRARALADSVLCLPLHAEPGDDAERVVNALRELAGVCA